MSDPSSAHHSARSAPSALLTLDIWAVAAAIAFIVLIVAGVLPRIPW
jgi:hypothetical protein